MSGYLDAIAALYGWNWAVDSERDAFLARLLRVADARFLWRAEPPPGPSALSVTSLRTYGATIEADFQRFTYRLQRLEPSDGWVVVRGELEAVARSSRQRVGRRFAHAWTIGGRGALHVEPLRDR